MAESIGKDPTMQAEIVDKLLPSRRTYRPDPIWRAMMLMIVGLLTLVGLISPFRLVASGRALFKSTAFYPMRLFSFLFYFGSMC